MRDRGARVHPTGAEHDAACVHVEQRERRLRREVDRGRRARAFGLGRSQRALQPAHLAAVIDGDRVAAEPAPVGARARSRSRRAAPRPQAGAGPCRRSRPARSRARRPPRPRTTRRRRRRRPPTPVRPAGDRARARPRANRRERCRRRSRPTRGRARRAAATSIASAYGTRTQSLSAPPHSRRAIGAMPNAAPAPAVAQLAVRPRRQELARAAAHLERHDHAVARPNARDRVADLEHVGDELVAERERTGQRRAPRDDRGVEIARRDRDRAAPVRRRRRRAPARAPRPTRAGPHPTNVSCCICIRAPSGRTICVYPTGVSTVVPISA